MDVHIWAMLREFRKEEEKKDTNRGRVWEHKPPQNMPRRHKDSFQLIILRNRGTGEVPETREGPPL